MGGSKAKENIAYATNMEVEHSPLTGGVSCKDLSSLYAGITDARSSLLVPLSRIDPDGSTSQNIDPDP